MTSGSSLVLFAFATGSALLACTAILGDFSTATDAPTDGGPTTDAPVLPGNDAGVDADASVPLLDDAVMVTSGRSHTCVIDAAQDVLCWGANSSGQLGVPIAQVGRSSVPVRVDIGGKAIAIAAGGAHTCAILADGKIVCWGANDRGQLGRGTLVPTGDVKPVSPPDANVTLWKAAEVITAGTSFTCAGVTEGSANGLPDRRFFCWGENVARQCGTEKTNGQPTAIPSLVTQSGDDNAAPGLDGYTISSGDEFACAGIYGAAGAAVFTLPVCWGSRAVGQIGTPPVPGGFDVNPQHAPSSNPDGGSGATFGLFKPGLLATGAVHGCFRIEQANVTPIELKCFGANTDGQTGSPTAGARPVEKVPGFDATSVTALAAGGRNTCVVVNGQVQCIGANELGQLGRGSFDTKANPVFANAVLPPSASAISVGPTHTCAVLGTVAGQKGQVACWGANESGQLGDGLDIDVGYPDAPDPLKRLRATPVRVHAPQK